MANTRGQLTENLFDRKGFETTLVTTGFFFHPVEVTTGITSASFSVTLAKNTLVRRFDLIVHAARAQRTLASNVAQFRSYSGAGGNTVVLDFGVPRTVSAIFLTKGLVNSVKAWTGAAFGNAFFGGDGSTAVTDAVFGSEVRSERLLVAVSEAITPADMILELSELPTDLEIRINGGPPVWTNPGPVQPVAGAVPLTEDGWNKDAERIVSLKDALNALLSDPLSTTAAAYEIKLTTRVPGVLEIREADVANHTRLFSFINRIVFESDTTKALAFAEEGFIDLPLPLPSLPARTTHEIEEVRLTAIGNLPPERSMPAVGPPPRTSNGTVLADLVLDAHHAACVRIGAMSDLHEQLAELTAIRLPLTTDGDGAEARVVLWSGDSEPSEPLPNGASKPVTLQAGAASDAMIRFDFPKPIKIDATNPPWAAVLVSRGTAMWALGTDPVGITATSPETPDRPLSAANVLRRGAPNGPWHPLPDIFQSGRSLASLGRVRVAGNGAKTAPVAPLLMRAFDQWIPVTPAAKGVPVVISGTARGGPVLRVVSRTAGTVTLRDVDVIWHPVSDDTLSGAQQPATAFSTV